jgi:hypothetical protein
MGKISFEDLMGEIREQGEEHEGVPVPIVQGEYSLTRRVLMACNSRGIMYHPLTDVPGFGAYIDLRFHEGI